MQFIRDILSGFLDALFDLVCTDVFDILHDLHDGICHLIHGHLFESTGHSLTSPSIPYGTCGCSS